MHRLLERQLKRHAGPVESIPEGWQSFIDAVNEAYRQADADRALLERSLDLTSEELIERNQQLWQRIAELEQGGMVLERRARQVQTITEIAQEIAAATELDELFRLVVTLVKERFGYYHAQIFRYDPELNAMRVVEGYGEVGEKMKAAGHNLPYGQGVVGTAAATGEAVLSSDVSQDSYWTPNPDLPDTWGELAVPIKLRRMEDGEWKDDVLGILDVQSDTAGALSEEDQVLLLGLAGQIAVAIQRSQLFQQAQARARREQTLRQITTRVRGFTDPEAVVRTAVRELGTALGRPAFVRLGSAEELRMKQ